MERVLPFVLNHEARRERSIFRGLHFQQEVVDFRPFHDFLREIRSWANGRFIYTYRDIVVQSTYFLGLDVLK